MTNTRIHQILLTAISAGALLALADYTDFALALGGLAGIIAMGAEQ
jgi:hypothetical protein